MTKKEVLSTIRELSDRLVSAQRPIRTLNAVKWDEKVRLAFFKGKFKQLPNVDRDYYGARDSGFNIDDKLPQLMDIELDTKRQLGELLSDLSTVVCLVVTYACLSGLGFFIGAFTVFWLVLRVCRHVNGAPFVVGDCVTVLTGPEIGTVTRVYEVVVGQGGGLLPPIDLGADIAAKHLDIYDDYSLLRQSQSTDSNTNA